MHRLIIATAALALSAGAASAVQFHNGLNPAFIDLGQSLQARRIIEDLTPGQPVSIHLIATAQVTAQCVNPNNDHAKPTTGTPEPIAVTGFQRIRKNQINSNNRALMNIVTLPPTTIIDGSPDCNGNDVEEITELAFSRARIIIEQPSGTQVLEARCRINPPSANGVIPASNVNCTIQ